MPLNEKLYSALLNSFGSVKIAREGEPMQFVVRPNPMNGRKMASVLDAMSGEYYRVCCPFCSDSRYRLWINHRWNTLDPVSGAAFGKGLCICYNDGCDLGEGVDRRVRRQKQDTLEKILKPYVAHTVRLRTPRRMVPKAVEAKLPHDCVPLSRLSHGHAAIQYLLSRGFDPAQLERDWQVLYCYRDVNPSVSERLIIPIYDETGLRGWQARYIGTPPSSNIPKYFTMPGTPRNNVLYNYYRASKYPFGILVEGVTDAWKVGLNAVASLGSSFSARHFQMMQAAWGSTGLGLLYDNELDDPKKARKYRKALDMLRTPNAFAQGVVEFRLPPGVNDPGDMDSTQLKAYLNECARLANFPFTVTV